MNYEKVGLLEILPKRYEHCNKCWHAEVKADEMGAWKRAWQSLQQYGTVQRAMGDEVEVVFTGRWQQRGDHAQRRMAQVWRAHRCVQAHSITTVLEGVGDPDDGFKPHFEDGTEPERGKWNTRDVLYTFGVKHNGVVQNDFGKRLFKQIVSCGNGAMCVHHNDSIGETLSGLRRTKDGVYTETAQRLSNAPGYYFWFHMKHVLGLDERSINHAMSRMSSFNRYALCFHDKCTWDPNTRQITFDEATLNLQLQRGVTTLHNTVTRDGAKLVFWNKEDYKNENGSNSSSTWKTASDGNASAGTGSGSKASQENESMETDGNGSDVSMSNKPSGSDDKATPSPFSSMVRDKEAVDIADATGQPVNEDASTWKATDTAA